MTRAPKKKKWDMKGRPRGGASVPCPVCNSDSRVIITGRNAEAQVVRKRECLGRAHHKFQTKESAI